jgi:hypothetical protein
MLTLGGRSESGPPGPSQFASFAFVLQPVKMRGATGYTVAPTAIR